jgi:hypothetical protein
MQKSGQFGKLMENVRYSAPVRKSGSKTMAFFNSQKIDIELQEKFQAMFPNAKIPIPESIPTHTNRIAAQREYIDRLATPRSISTKRREIELARYKEELLKHREIPQIVQPPETPRSHFKSRFRCGPLHQPDRYRLQEANAKRAALQKEQEEHRNRQPQPHPI